MARYAVFLRGINVGRKNALPMAELRAWVEQDGFAGVRTYVQTGNLVLDGSGSVSEVEERVATAIASHYHRPITVTARSHAELRKVVSYDPFGDVADNPARYWVAFCTAMPEAGSLRRLLERDFGAEQLAARGTELYLWSPDQVGRSELSEAVNAARIALGCDMTVRNWRTTAKVLAMLED